MRQGGRAAGLDALTARLGEVETSRMTGREHAAFVSRLEATRTRLMAVALAHLQRLDASGSWSLDGAYDPANWLKTTTGTARAEAGSRVRMAHNLTLMAHAAEALGTAEITEAHVRVLARCLGPRTRDLFFEHEEMLVSHARQLNADDLARVVDYWLIHADPDGARPADGTDRDTFSASRTLDGRVKGRFDLGAAWGTELLERLDEMVDELHERDKACAEVDPADGAIDRPPANRRAEALIELLRRGGTAPDNPARRRPHVEVVIDPRTAAGQDAGEDALHELADGTVVPRALIEQWLCDCTIARVVLTITGAVLARGRDVRTATPEQRRALIARDRGCAVPGCDRPPHWTDAHHIRWWHRDHGPTDIDNLVLLCNHHHQLVHARHLTVRMIEGIPHFWNRHGDHLDRRPRAA